MGKIRDEREDSRYMEGIRHECGNSNYCFDYLVFCNKMGGQKWD